MGNSLQDQLLKAGLVSDKQVKQVNKDQRKSKKQQRKNKQATVDETAVLAQQAKAEKAERDKRLNEKREAEAKRKELLAQIRLLIVKNRQPREEGDVAYQFVDNKKVKKIYVSEALHSQLIGGQVAIAKLGERYEIVPRAVAEKIAERDSGFVILPSKTEQSDDDDYYADFQVPDDLMW